MGLWIVDEAQLHAAAAVGDGIGHLQAGHVLCAPPVDADDAIAHVHSGFLW
jgi:hypothetical protein